MRCDRCREAIPTGEEMLHFGRKLCEECYMQALSPARSCDPWAVRSAQALSQLDEDYSELSETQTEILKLLEETGGAEPEMIAETLGMKLPELQRELATLRHMEKVRGALREDSKVVCLW